MISAPLETDSSVLWTDRDKSVRTNWHGKKHKDAVKKRYLTWIETEAQKMFESGIGAALNIVIPPPPNIQDLPGPVVPGQVLPVMAPIPCSMPVMESIPQKMKMMPGMGAPAQTKPVSSTPVAKKRRVDEQCDGDNSAISAPVKIPK
ncbi:uncharacterized protein TNCV_678271 [Trichonephila clavipes]|nr:uncharacterized protein TNCV_678271 [Trichonephila clavipes]